MKVRVFKTKMTFFAKFIHYIIGVIWGMLGYNQEKKSENQKETELRQGVVNSEWARKGDKGWELRKASERGNLEEVKRLVAEGVDIHEQNGACLRNATMNGHLEVVKFLVEKGVDIHAYNDWVFAICNMNGQKEILKFLMEVS